ncbi:hypothetical protein K438DRAFT_2013299 [Mycena galopus ATCC 62051]|nr:hypothetical protein K438DRAFT_2013299 [Mycena galopus ATCC 62051]
MSDWLPALRNLVVTNAQLVRGAQLRALEWTSPTGTDALTKFLSTPGYFPNLKDLSVHCGLDSHFECFRVPGLQKLECKLEFSGSGYEEWKPSWKALRRALEALPASSPLLHSLSLKLDLYFYEDSDDEQSDFLQPWSIDPDLKAAINQLRLSALTSFHLSLDPTGFNLRNPAMDFSSMLRAHPLLTTITLNIEGICVPPDVDNTFLSHIVSLTSSVKNCATILPHTPTLRRIIILFPADTWCNDFQDTLDFEYRRPLTPALFPAHAFPDVRSLDARGVTRDGGTASYTRTFYPDSLSCLIAAFPNLTHLDVSLAKPLREYCPGFASLLGLEQLSVRLSIYPPMQHYGRRGTALYPPERFAAELNDTLLVLPVLSDVHIVLWIDRSDTYVTGCESCDLWEPNWFDILVEYWFDRVFEDGDEAFKLVRMTASDEAEPDVHHDDSP